MNRAGKRRARETAERRGGSEERAADKGGGKTERRTGERFEDVEGQGSFREGRERNWAVGPLRLPRRRLWPERGALTSAAER